ncbi:hypothetical protein [Campylobacter upsaliensis]|uniref:hypothetical protein n=1 Tax=Campylobacter upsaliensis TaxID=28080 RepID=UPI00214A4634|nr:hypothetical protein [Campylobacter upsaliensis]MCR2104885.1 hypothetical protein [Campylobacter upsaliensis]MCR2110914.1 hypothetical protein [Campylobacter upsaliensis]
MINVLNQFLNFLDLNTKTIFNDKTKKTKENQTKESEEEFLDEEQHYQYFENKEILKENGVEFEIKTITELIPQGNKKTLKKQKQETILLRK